MLLSPGLGPPQPRPLTDLLFFSISISKSCPSFFAFWKKGSFEVEIGKMRHHDSQMRKIGLAVISY